MKPVLALDVDGPLALMGNHPQGEVWRVWVADMPVTISRRLPERLAVLADAFQIVWSSSWGKRASYQIAPLVGLPQGLPFVRFGAGRRGESYKLPGLKKFLRDCPAAIVDDEIGNDMRKWASERAAPTLLVEIDPRFGLVDEHVAELLRFASRA